MTKFNTAVKVASYLLAAWALLFRLESDTGTTATTATTVGGSSTPPVEQGWSLKRSFTKHFRKNHTPCCQDYFAEIEAGNTYSDGTARLPPSCLVQGATCPKYNIYVNVELPAAMVGGELGSTTCTDSERRVRTSAVIGANIVYYTGEALPSCAEFDTITPSTDWWYWWSLVEFWFYHASVLSMFYTALLPLKYADEGYRVFETMSYGRRLMATSTLWFISGGGCFLFISSEVHALHWIWVVRGTWTCVVLIALFTLWTFLFIRPLPFKIPAKKSFDNCILALLREYFDLTEVNESGMALDVKGTTEDNTRKDKTKKDNTYLLALMPHAVMPYGAMLGASVLPRMLPDVWPVSGVVATALMRTPVLRHLINHLGVREAGTASIVQMFADLFQAVAVVTGGIAEMFVRSDKEVLARIRRGFGHIAIKGGHGIIPIFTFGVSRTHSVFPGFNNWFVRWLSRKATVPLFLFSGACGLIPRRQQMKMVVGRPIAVEQVTKGVTDKDAEKVCNKVQTSVIDIYNRHKPFWEHRPIEYIK